MWTAKVFENSLSEHVLTSEVAQDSTRRRFNKWILLFVMFIGQLGWCSTALADAPVLWYEVAQYYHQIWRNQDPQALCEEAGPFVYRQINGYTVLGYKHKQSDNGTWRCVAEIYIPSTHVYLDYSLFYPRRVYLCWDESKPNTRLPLEQQCSSQCDTNYLDTCLQNSVIPSKNKGLQCRSKEGNPCNPGTGIKTQIEPIYHSRGLDLTLTYSSDLKGEPYPKRQFRFGHGWTFRYGTNLLFLNNGKVAVARPNGKIFEFRAPQSGSVYLADADVPDVLEKRTDATGNLSGWRYRVAASGEVEQYDTAGHLVAITLRSGQQVTLSYSDASTPAEVAPVAGLLISVRHQNGRQLSFSYNADSRIVTMRDPAGGEYRFAYDGPSSHSAATRTPAGNLTAVTFPGDASRVYHYNEPERTGDVDLPNTLTGISDESGKRFANWNYDAKGRALMSEHAGGVEHVELSYNADGTTTAIDAGGAKRIYHFTTVHGVVKPARIDTDDGSERFTYDANGYLDTRTDKKGIVTDYTYDTQGRKLSVVEAAGTPAARRIDYRYENPDYPQRVTEIREPAGSSTNPGDACTVGVDCKVITITYDAFGRVLKRTEQTNTN